MVKITRLFHCIKIMLVDRNMKREFYFFFTYDKLVLKIYMQMLRIACITTSSKTIVMEMNIKEL